MIEATNQIGAGKKVTDRRGDVWGYGNYNSPSGPAFWITLPERYWPEWAGNYTIHFDGVMGMSQDGGETAA